jgi:hypothetical protein
MHTGLPGYRVLIIQRTPDGSPALVTNMAARDFAEKDRGRLHSGGTGDSMR